jgi:hypothetical protein
MGKFTLADWSISLAGAGFFAWIGVGGHSIMMFVSGAIIVVSVWRSIRRERDRRESHKMTMKERDLKYKQSEARGWQQDDPTEDSWN